MPATETCRTVSFVIDGAWLADTARAMCIEGRWETGYEVLKDGLEGITADQVLAILRGEQTLTGDSTVGVGMEPFTGEAQTKYLNDFAYQFEGVWKTEDGRYLRPYAVVTAWGPEDLYYIPGSGHGTQRYFRGGPSTKGSDQIIAKSNGATMFPTQMAADFNGDPIDFAFRSLYYADDPKRDVLKKLKIPAEQIASGHTHPQGETVLFREISNYPSLLVGKVHRTAQAALDAYLARKCGLDVRGYHREFPKDVFALRCECREITDSCNIAETRFDIEDDEGNVVKKGASYDTRAMAQVAREAAKMAPIAGKARLDRYLEMVKEQDKNLTSVEVYREAIMQQAGDDFIDLTYTPYGQRIEGTDEFTNPEPITLKVPRAPFEQWVMWRTDGAHLAAPWKKVSPPGLKMLGDDPYHTDWILGAGLALDDWAGTSQTSDPLVHAAWNLRYQIAQRLLKSAAAVLSGAGVARGTVVHLKPGDRLKAGEIGVIRNAGPDYVQAAQDAINNGGALITENGGAVAHLVTVFREQDLKIVRVQNARKKYPAGGSVTIDFSDATVTLAEGDMKSIWNMFDVEGEVEGYAPAKEDDDA